MVPARTWARTASRLSLVAYTSVIPVYRLDVSLEYTLNEKKASRSQQEASLREAVDEALNQDQTERDLFLSAVGCTVESAFDDMRLIKKMWHKEKGVQGFHLVQSFAPGEASPELAHQIGQEFAQKLLDGKFQVVISTHLNTKCLHNHLVWNSVSLTNGKKYRSNQKTYITRIRRISDELCQKYHLSIIDTEKSQQAAIPYAQWLAEKKGQPTWKTVIQQDVDAAAISALTWKQFLWILGQQGYTFQLNRKYFTLRPPGKERPVRFKTLGPDYTPEAIQRRILETQPPLPAGKRTAPARRFTLRAGKLPSRGITGLRALYFSYLYQMGVLKKKPRRPSYALREDIRKLDQRIEQMEFIFRNQIQDREQLASIRQEKETEIEALVKERQKFYRYKPGTPQISVFTDRLRELRHTVKLCREIAAHSMEMEQRMRAARLEEQRRREQQEQEKRKKEAWNRENQKRR